MKNYIKYIKSFLMILSLSSLIVLFFPRETYKNLWSISWWILVFVMVIRPLRDIFWKCKIFVFLSKFRREFWILMAVFAIAHWMWAFMEYKWYAPDKTYIQMLFDPFVWDYTLYMFWWMIAAILSVPLLLTSNSISTSILWKYWKTLQRLSYIIFPLAWIHIFLIEKEDYLPIILVLIWIILFIIAFIKNKKLSKNTSVWPKWLCVPCGYIYDENIWDPDSWIMPWTKFEDIPNDWRCPVCWVGKWDFILLESDIKINQSEIVSLKYLTQDTIELKVDLKDELNYISWQFLNFCLIDDNWPFNRSYSIANKVWNIYTFLIKLKIDWRAWILLKSKKVWDKLDYTFISWTFKLQNNDNTKVFIATWTGLSPIYSMLLNTNENIKKELYFWVATQKDLFYIEELSKIKNLKLNIFLSREKVDWYNYWRINLENISFEANSEFYICWNPWVVFDSKKTLLTKWFTQIFTEEFK